MQLSFASPLDPSTTEKPGAFEINTWDLKRSRKYGSKRYNTQTLAIDKMTLSKDGKNLMIHLPDIQPTWVVEIKYDLQAADGTQFQGAIQGTIHVLGPDAPISSGSLTD